MKNAKDGDKDMAKMSVIHNTNLILTYSYTIQSQLKTGVRKYRKSDI